MTQIKNILLLLLTGLPWGTASFAQNPLKKYEFTHPQMGAVFRLVFYAENDSLAASAAQAAFDRVDTLNAVMTDYQPDSELMRLCEKAGTGEKVPVSYTLWRVLRLSLFFCEETEGTFDVTVGPLTRLWRRARHLQELPDSAQVAAAQALVGWRNVKLYENPYRVELLQKGMKLDLGGIGQGFAADECLKVLRNFGIAQALADAGGDIAIGAPPPGEKGWVIEIPDTLHNAPLVLSYRGITTSGATSRYIEGNGRRYSHIVDPRTGWGQTQRVLVTVLATTATEADVWATAISVMGEQEWKLRKWLAQDIQVWLTQTDW